MNVRQRWLVSRLGLVVVLLCGSLGAASAQEGTPPVPFGSFAGPAAPAAVTAACVGGELHCQLNSPGLEFISSQDFIPSSFQDATAADDFVISSTLGVRSWEISAITVDGLHYPGQTPVTTTNSVNVRFYADNGQGRPGTVLFTPTVGISNTSVASGDFYLTLSPPVRLAADGHYWVSVQAVKPDGEGPPQWMWVEQSQWFSPAVWQNPGNGFFTGCVTWTPLSTCNSAVGPDLGFSVVGASSNVTSTTPILTHLTPPGGLDEEVIMSLSGHNFSPGAVVSWTVPSSPTYTTTANFISSTSLTATIPAGQVTPVGSTATVVVVNPAPCYGSCASNSLLFIIEDLKFVYLPTIRR